MATPPERNEQRITSDQWGPNQGVPDLFSQGRGINPGGPDKNTLFCTFRQTSFVLDGPMQLEIRCHGENQADSCLSKNPMPIQGQRIESRRRVLTLQHFVQAGLAGAHDAGSRFGLPTQSMNQRLNDWKGVDSVWGVSHRPSTGARLISRTVSRSNIINRPVPSSSRLRIK